MIRSAACSFFAATLIFAAAACGGSSTKSAVSTAAPEEGTPAAVTGDGPLDVIIDAMLRADVIEIAALTGYSRVPCKKGTADQAGGAPLCRESERDGQSVEVLPSSACGKGWVRPEQVPDAYEYNLGPDKPELFEVFKPRSGPTTYGGGFGAQQTVVIRSRTTSDGKPAGVAFHVFNGRVVWIEAGCSGLSELTAPGKVEAVIFDPKDPAASPSPKP